jgi:hypothetical protein
MSDRDTFGAESTHNGVWKDELILSIVQFKKAIESFLADPGEIPLLKIRKDFLKRRKCPLKVGVGGFSRGLYNHTMDSITGYIADNPAVSALRDKIKQKSKSADTYPYLYSFCDVCPLGDKNGRCRIDEFHSIARARMALQQEIKSGKAEHTVSHKILDGYRSTCSTLMGSCLIGLIELSAILSSIVDGDKNKHDEI